MRRGVRTVPRSANWSKRGLALANAKQTLQGVIAPAAWTAETAKTRRALAAHGRSWLRLFNAEYREASAISRGCCVDRPPSGLEAQLKLLDQLAEAQQARQQLKQNRVWAELGAAAFGKRWAGADSDWTALSAIERWEAETAARFVC